MLTEAEGSSSFAGLHFWWVDSWWQALWQESCPHPLATAAVTTIDSDRKGTQLWFREGHRVIVDQPLDLFHNNGTNYCVTNFLMDDCTDW